mmetsp:Transcript_14165/g.34943  ORF Transcript_14165/g.34943 Transcript_14165/m.34943 type:complete len:244 (+) Transcript_14165:3113-3844(+)
MPMHQPTQLLPPCARRLGWAGGRSAHLDDVLHHLAHQLVRVRSLPEVVVRALHQVQHVLPDAPAEQLGVRGRDGGVGGAVHREHLGQRDPARRRLHVQRAPLLHALLGEQPRDGGARVGARGHLHLTQLLHPGQQLLAKALPDALPHPEPARHVDHQRHVVVLRRVQQHHVPALGVAHYGRHLAAQRGAHVLNRSAQIRHLLVVVAKLKRALRLAVAAEVKPQGADLLQGQRLGQLRVHKALL